MRTEEPPRRDRVLRVLLVEDHPADAFLAHEYLQDDRSARYELHHRENLRDALTTLRGDDVYDIALVDLSLPDSRGLETFHGVHSAFPDMPIVVLTGLADQELAVQAVRAGAQDYLVKADLTPTLLSRTIWHALERKELQRSVAANERRFRALIERSRDAKLLVDPAGRILYASPASAEIFGMPVEDQVGSDGFELIWAEDVPRIEEALERILAMPDGTLEGRVRAVRADGRTLVLDYAVTNYLADPNIRALVVNCQDVTHQVRTRVALEESESRYKRLFDHSLDGVVRTTPDGAIIEVNPAFLRMLGYSADEAAGLRREDVVDVSDPRLPQALEERRRTGRFRGELSFRHKDGSAVPCEITTNLFLNADGREETSMIVRDVSERKRTQLELAAYQEQLALAEQASFVMIAHTGLDGRWLKVPSRLCRLLGRDEEDLLAMRYQDVTHPDDVAGDEAMDRALIEGRAKSLEREKRYLRADGSVMWAYINASIVKGTDGRPLHLRTYVRDVTAERAAEEQALREYALLLGRITDLAENVGLARDPSDVYRALFEFARASSPADAIIVSHFDAGTATRRCVLAGGLSDGAYREWDTSRLPPLELNDSLQSRAILERRPIAVGDLSILDRHSGHGGGEAHPDPDLRPPRSAVAVPMMVHGEVVGAFELQSVAPGAFDDSDLTPLLMAADLAAIAAKNVELLQQQQAARAQAESERARLQGVLEQAPALTATVEGPDHVFTSANEKYLQFFAGRPILGRRVVEVLPEIEAQGVIDLLDRVYRTGESFVASEMPMDLDVRGDGTSRRYYFNLVYQALRDPDGTVSGVLAQAMDITAQVESRRQTESLHAALQESYDRTIEGWARALDLKDEETAGHSQRVTDTTLQLAARMGMSEEELVHVRRGALLHDIGKMGVPDRILLKPGKLDPEEWEIMKRHTVYARDFLLPIEHLRPALDIPYGHHERWDGSGYPEGRSGRDIPLAARIFAAVDVFDALTSDRPYRPAWSRERALDFLREGSGGHFDPDVVEAFLQLQRADRAAD